MIGKKKEWQFVYDFILEELEEYKEACEKGDIVGILDALCDITYVSLGNGTLLHGLKSKIWEARLRERLRHRLPFSPPWADRYSSRCSDDLRLTNNTFPASNGYRSHLCSAVHS